MALSRESGKCYTGRYIGTIFLYSLLSTSEDWVLKYFESNELEACSGSDRMNRPYCSGDSVGFLSYRNIGVIHGEWKKWTLLFRV